MNANIHIPNPYGGNHINRPNMVVVHGMGEYILHKGKWYHAVEFLMKVRLSAHFLITPSGVGIRLRDDSERASHALGHNTDTLGVEFLVPGTFSAYQPFLDAMKTDWVTEQAYDKGVQLVKWWQGEHNIDRVRGHCDIDPERKEDPGVGFPNQFYIDIGH